MNTEYIYNRLDVLIEIISNYDQKMGVVDKSGDLYNWLILLTRFTNNQPLPKSLTSQIEANFSYFWSKDRLSCLNSDEQYLETLPRKIKNQIMTVYLFSEKSRTAIGKWPKLPHKNTSSK